MNIKPLRTIFLFFVMANLGVVFPLVSQAQDTAPLSVKQVPLPPEKNPPGDIPDTQVFVAYHSRLGFSLKVPEGWARRLTPDGATFTNAYDGIAIQVGPSTKAPTVSSVKQHQAAILQKSPTAVRISKIVAVHLPSGPAIRISFSSNSAPNAITGKAIRLENDQYLIWHQGQLVTLTLFAPYGADNVDQWRLMAHSFQWQ